MKIYNLRKRKLLQALKKAKKSNKNSISLKILYTSDKIFLEEIGYVVLPTNRKNWYKIFKVV